MITEKETINRAAALNRAAEGVHTLTLDARKAATLAAKLELGRPNAPTPGDIARAIHAVGELADAALTDVLKAGGVVAKWEQREAQANRGLDLSDLAAATSDEARELLDALDRAQELAERLDASRGRCVGDNIALQPGESRGTDYAEAVSHLALRLRRETFGAVGAGRE